MCQNVSVSCKHSPEKLQELRSEAPGKEGEGLPQGTLQTSGNHSNSQAKMQLRGSKQILWMGQC